MNAELDRLRVENAAMELELSAYRQNARAAERDQAFQDRLIRVRLWASLGPQAGAMLLDLLDHAGQVRTREQLQACAEIRRLIDDRDLRGADAKLKRVRRSLAERGFPGAIRSLSGAGWTIERATAAQILKAMEMAG